MKYSVTYTETYSGTYEVEANSKKEAEELVRSNIWEGIFDAPNDCLESKCEAWKIKED